ncbi:MAG: type VI immunity family protein [Pseudomonadota bacterium]
MSDLQTLGNMALAGEDETLIAPCVQCVIYLQHAPTEHLVDFADKAMAALKSDLGQFVSGRAKRFAAVGPESDDQFDVLFKKLRPGDQRWMLFRGGAPNSGVHPATLEITHMPLPPLPTEPDAIAAKLEQLEGLYGTGAAVFMPHVTTLKASFMLNHPLSDPDALLEWIKDLQCVKETSFVSGHVGYALIPNIETGNRANMKLVQEAMAAALARHPGLDWEDPGSVTAKLVKYWPGHVEFLPRIKRANWLTLVRNLMLEELCAGRATVEAALGKAEEVQLHDLGDGMIIQAGDAPALGDVTEGNRLPSYRAVARALAGARLPSYKGMGKTFTDDIAQAWLEALETGDD